MNSIKFALDITLDRLIDENRKIITKLRHEMLMKQNVIDTYVDEINEIKREQYRRKRNE